MDERLYNFLKKATEMSESMNLKITPEELANEPATARVVNFPERSSAVIKIYLTFEIQ